MTTPYPRILSKVFTEPWEILPAAHAAISSALRAHMESGEQLAPPPREGLGPDRRDERRFRMPVDVSYEHGIAIMHVQGTMGKRLSWLESYCGGCDLSMVDQDIEELRNDDRIETIIFDIDSPGGLALASADTADRIVELSEEKRTITYSDGTLASAAYKLAAATDEIYAAASADVGSIGTFIALLDSSRAYEMDGLDLKLFRDGKYKAMGMPGKPVTEEESQLLQSEVDQLSAKFKQFVRDHRQSVRESAMQGQVMDGRRAQSAGLVDGIFRDLNGLIAAELERLAA